MNVDEDGASPDDRLADAMASYDDILATGEGPPPEALREAVDPKFLRDWNRLAAFLTLVERAWPRGVQDRDRDTRALPTATEPPAESTLSGTGGQFGRFQILRSLGQGGFGIVFLAWDPSLRRQVALKVPQPEALVTPEARKRFLREAHAAAGLDHPNIVPVHETGSVGTVAYMASAYCPGPTLAEWLARQVRPAPPRDAAALTATLARAVEHAHGRGVLHRDLKPSNVLLQRPGTMEPEREGDDGLAGFQPRITDFSLAWVADGEGPKTLSGVPIGSPSYMAPEQAEGRLKSIGPPTDVYGLGCILYELLVGDPPFRGDSQVEILRRVGDDDPLPPRRVRRDTPIALEAIVLKCLAKDPASRYLAAGDLADDLDRFLAGEPTRARPVGLRGIIGRRLRRHPVTLAVIIISVVFIGVSLAGVRWTRSRLDHTLSLARQRDEDVRVRLRDLRRAAYVADIRQAAQFASDGQTNLALDLLRRHRGRPGEDDLREFGWYHVLRRCHTERATLSRHGGDVYHAEFSPDGRLLATAGLDGMVRLWDAMTGSFIRAMAAHGDEVNWVRFSPDGRTIATACDDGRARLWDLASGRNLITTPAHRGVAVVVLFTPDGRRVVSCGHDDVAIKTWDAATGRLLSTFHSDVPAIESIALSPDGSIVAVAGGSRTVVVGEPASGRRIVSLGPHGDVVCGVAFSYDGTRVATGSKDGMVRLWQVGGGRLLSEYAGHARGVQSVAFSPDDRVLISAGDDNTIRLWDVGTNQLRGIHLGHRNRIWGVSLSPDGRTIASASRDQTVKLWDTLATGAVTRLSTKHQLTTLAFAADSRTLIAASADGMVLRCEVGAATLRETETLDDADSTVGMALARNGALAAVCKKDGFIAIHDLARRQVVRTIGPVAGRVAALQFGVDGRQLAAVIASHGVSLWSVQAAERPSSLPGKFTDAVFSPDGTVFCVGDWGVDLLVWNPAVAFEKTRKYGPSAAWNKPTVICVSPDARLFAATNDREVGLWRSEPQERIASLDAHADRVLALTFSPDGKTLATAGSRGSLKLWDVAARDELLKLELHAGPVRSICFSPDGNTLASCADRPDGTSEIFLWRALEDEPDRAASSTDRFGRPAP